MCAPIHWSFAVFFDVWANPRWNVDVCLDNPTDAKEFDNLPAYTLDLVSRLERAYQLVRANVSVAAETNRRWYDRSVRESTFEEGDRVRVYVPNRVKGRSPKLQSYYKDVGIILKRLNQVTYLVCCKSWKENRVIHVDKLKPFFRFDDPMTVNPASPAPAATRRDVSTENLQPDQSCSMVCLIYDEYFDCNAIVVSD